MVLVHVRRLAKAGFERLRPAPVIIVPQSALPELRTVRAAPGDVDCEGLAVAYDLFAHSVALRFADGEEVLALIHDEDGTYEIRSNRPFAVAGLRKRIQDARRRRRA